MVWCNHCGKNVPGIRPYDGALSCDLCGRILENFNFSTQVTFVKNAAGQSQASGNIVKSPSRKRLSSTFHQLDFRTVSFSIAINGELLKNRKGLRRQGDSISPYLFVLAMEILGSSLDSGYNSGLIS